MQANIFKIKRNELADGSGLRTTIYFQRMPPALCLVFNTAGA